MNLPLFLKTVDDLTREMSHEELEVFIHNTARTLPEGKRDSFIQELRTAEMAADSETVYKKLELSDKQEIIEEMQRIQKTLTRIDEGEFCLESEINPEYDDWYNSDEDEFLFEDTP